MKKFLVFFVLLVLVISCEEPGTVKRGYDDDPFHYCVIDKDTLDFYSVWPSKSNSIMVAKFRNQTSPTTLEYRVGKRTETVIVLDHANDWLVKKQRIVNGSVISENDSIVVIKKNKP